MLANAAGVLFFFRSVKQWTLLETVGYALAMFLAIEMLNWGVFFMFENHSRPRIPAGGQALWKRGWTDYAFITFNKTATVAFSYHLAHYIFYSETMPKALNEMTVWNTVFIFPLLFIVYDFPYSLFHRALHHKSIYAHVHKHHHREAAPVHGHDDAVNTHPFEFVVGEYLHLFAIALLPCHAIAGVTFVALGGILASLSHTRFDIHVQLGPLVLYSVKEHDTHHKMLKGNYGQYTQVWDRVFSTFYDWVPVNLDPSGPSADGGGPNRTPVPTPGLTKKGEPIPAPAPVPTGDAPKSCAVFPAHTPLGLRTVASLAARGAATIVAIAPTAEAAETVTQALAAGLLKGTAAEETGAAAAVTVVTADPSSVADANGAAHAAIVAALTAAETETVFIITSGDGIYATDPTARSPMLTPSAAVGAKSRHTRTVRAVEGILAASSAAKVSVAVALTDPFAAAHCDGSFLAADVPAATETARALLHHASAGRGPSVGGVAGAQLMVEMRVLSENISKESPLATAVVAAPRVYSAGHGDLTVARELLKASLAYKEHILSSGSNVQSLTHADNAIHALILAAARTKRAGKAAPAAPAAVLPASIDAMTLADGSENTKFDEESFVATLEALRGSDAYTVVADAEAQYVWDVVERLRLSVGLSTVWDCFHIYNHLLYPLAYAGHLVTAVTGKPAPWPLHVTPSEIETATKTLYFDCSKAAKVLGYAPVAPSGLKGLYADVATAGKEAFVAAN